ncbi:MAG: DsbA family protein, partial [Patescibacteria group bacterium]
CRECYDVTEHRGILSRYGLAAKEEKLYDAASKEGKELLARFGITATPTFILEGDLEPYVELVQIWPKIGSKNGNTYVFRKLGLSSMGVVYKDLITGKTINPQSQIQPTQTDGQDHGH